MYLQYCYDCSAICIISSVSRHTRPLSPAPAPSLTPQPRHVSPEPRPRAPPPASQAVARPASRARGAGPSTGSSSATRGRGSECSHGQLGHTHLWATLVYTDTPAVIIHVSICTEIKLIIYLA